MNQILGMQWQAFGQMSFSGVSLKLFEGLVTRIKQMGERVGADSLRFGSFIEAEDLQKMDYLHSFPQHVTFAANVCCDQDSLRRFREGDQFDERGNICIEEFSPVRAILTPAACYHIYIALQGKNLEKRKVVSTGNTCYRRESEYVPLRRQWAFNMYELVCIGTEEEVSLFVEEIGDMANKLAGELSLPFAWQTAEDPFFDPQNSAKYLLQKIQPNKREMVFGGDLAIGSLNRHRNYFGEIFSISKGGVPAHSCCMAFGLERWIYAILSAHGSDSSRWPDAVVRLLEE